MLTTLTNIEIEDMLSKQAAKQYRGFFMRDETPKPKQVQGYYLVNIGDEAGEGTHWTMSVITPNSQPNLYFDPFGMPPPEEVDKWLKSKNKDVLYSTTQLQDPKATSCGWWVVACLEYLTKHKKKGTYVDNLFDFVTKVYDDNTEKNEELLRLERHRK